MPWLWVPPGAVAGYTVFAGETVMQTPDYFEVGYKVYIGQRKYFVTSDVGEGRIQWYAFLGLPPGAPPRPPFPYQSLGL